MIRNRPSNKRHSKQNVAAAMSGVPPPLAEPKLIMVKNRQHRCHTAKRDFSVSQVPLYNTAPLHQPYDIPAVFRRKESQALPRGQCRQKRILAKTRMKIKKSFVRCTTTAHGGPCEVFVRIGQTPWEEHSLQASADFSIVVGTNPLGILVFIDFLKRCPLNAGTPTPHCDFQISLGKTRHVSTCLSMLRRS